MYIHMHSNVLGRPRLLQSGYSLDQTGYREHSILSNLPGKKKMLYHKTYSQHRYY